MSTLSLNSSDLKFTETEFQLGLGTGIVLIDTRCGTCTKKMYKEVAVFIITPTLIRKEIVYVCYRCGVIRRSN